MRSAASQPFAVPDLVAPRPEHPSRTSRRCSTDPVTPGNSATAITWQYAYGGDLLSSACDQSQGGQPCTAYTYQSGSDYPAAVLDSGPQSYWRLNEGTGSTAAGSVLTNEGTDNATYANVVQDVQQSPLAGTSSSVGAAGFQERPTCRCPAAWPTKPGP